MTGLGRSAIRRLRSGIVPSESLEKLSVGYESVTVVIDESLNALSAKGRCTPLFVRGEWGTGKSHMLEFVRTAAARRRIAHVRVDLNARASPLNYPQRFYPWIAESVALCAERGIRAIVEGAFVDESRRKALLQFAWAAESGVLGAALKSIILASRELHSDVLVDGPGWDVVSGVDLAPFDWKRPKALERTAMLARLLRTLGGAGLVIVLDEVETVDQLWNRLSRLGAYQTLGALCRSDATWAVFGVTDRFDRRVQFDLDNRLLIYSQFDEASQFLRTWGAGGYRVVAPPAVTDAHAEQLVDCILVAYRSAYSDAAIDRAEASEVLSAWKRNPSRNPRRLIRALIDTLDARRPLAIQSTGTA